MAQAPFDQPVTLLDSIIELQALRVTRDPIYGSRIETWVKVDDVWAGVDQTGTSESFENDAAREIPLRFATFRIRHRADVREDWRVVYDGLAWDVEGISEVGFNRFLDIVCQTDTSRKP